ncbi:hypothetical protein Tco_0646200 [Tanacetum coccineum]
MVYNWSDEEEVRWRRRVVEEELRWRRSLVEEEVRWRRKVVEEEGWHGYAVSSLMDTAYWMSEQYSSNVFV